MIVYHGTNLKVDKPKLINSNRYLDFGSGFYTITNYEQAVNFANKVSKRNGGKAIVNKYSFDESNLAVLLVKCFSSPDKQWLDFVSKNRNGISFKEQYDIVIGPVANDDVYRTLQLYFSSLLSKEQALEMLKIKSLYTQYTFKSVKALFYLKFMEAIDV